MNKRSFVVFFALLGLYSNHSHAMQELDIPGPHGVLPSTSPLLVADDPSSTQASSVYTMDPKELFFKALGQLRTAFRLLEGNVDSILDASEKEFRGVIEKQNSHEPKAKDEPIQSVILSPDDQASPVTIEGIVTKLRVDVGQEILGCEDQLVNGVMKRCEVIIRRQMGVIQNLQQRLAVARHKHTLAILEGERARYFTGIIMRQDGVINCLEKQLEESRRAQLGVARDSDRK
ncbi:MAG: hypothetical protein JSR85_04590 [Proteobacteria bacterium]|nr:hypothetical protein [Pseudomonadota bacterium]